MPGERSTRWRTGSRRQLPDRIGHADVQRRRAVAGAQRRSDAAAFTCADKPFDDADARADRLRFGVQRERCGVGVVVQLLDAGDGGDRTHAPAVHDRVGVPAGGRRAVERLPGDPLAAKLDAAAHPPDIDAGELASARARSAATDTAASGCG